MVLKAKPNSLLNKVVHQLSSSSTTPGSSSTAQTAAAAISKYANLFTSTAAAAAKGTSSPTVSSKPNPFTRPDGTASGAMTPVNRGTPRMEGVRGELVDKGLEDKVWETDGMLLLATAERMLKWHAEAVGRVVELSPSSEVYVTTSMACYWLTSIGARTHLHCQRLWRKRLVGLSSRLLLIRESLADFMWFMRTRHELIQVRWPNSKITIPSLNPIFEPSDHSRSQIRSVISVRGMQLQQSSRLLEVTSRFVAKWVLQTPSISPGWRGKSMQ